MRPALRILLKSLVWTFYRQNAGQFVLVYILFFGAVGELEGPLKHTGPVYQLHYQYSLIVGLLSSHIFLGIAGLIWLLYGEKCSGFVLASLQRPDFRFLDILNRLSPVRSFACLFYIQCLLFLPIILYTLAIDAVALYKRWYAYLFFVDGYILLLCLVGAIRYNYQLNNPGKTFFRTGSGESISGGIRQLLHVAPGHRIYFSILLKSLVKPFYRHNAGFFLFIFLVFFGVIAPSMQPAYHYSLIMGMLGTPAIFAGVFLAWLLYAIKCSSWVRDSLNSPECDFLQILSRVGRRETFGGLLLVQILLFIPVSAYALIITGVALYHRLYTEVFTIQSYILLIHIYSACLYQYFVYVRSVPPVRSGLGPGCTWASSYWSFLVRYWWADCKALYGGLKLFGCGILYLLLRDQHPEGYDVRISFLLYSLALFGHGVLIYRCRELEEGRLLFYRNLPVSLLHRFGQYAVCYFLVLIPEVITIGWLTPGSIRLIDAIEFILAGYSILLFLNSLLCVISWRMLDFLKLSLALFGVLYFCVLTGLLIAMSGVLCLAAFGLFYGGYRRYERRL